MDWQVYYNVSNELKLKAIVSVESGGLQCTELYNGVSLTVEGNTYYANSKSIDYKGGALKKSEVATFVMDAPASAANLSATWTFRGTYSGKDVDTITAEGIIS